MGIAVRPVGTSCRMRSLGWGSVAGAGQKEKRPLRLSGFFVALNGF